VVSIRGGEKQQDWGNSNIEAFEGNGGCTDRGT
jgi:hypothetical protein